MHKVFYETTSFRVIAKSVYSLGIVLDIINGSLQLIYGYAALALLSFAGMIAIIVLWYRLPAKRG